jgi:hypothetical protein
VQARDVGGVRSSSVGSESCRLLSSGGISGMPGLGGGDGGGTGIRASTGGGGLRGTSGVGFCWGPRW